MVYDLSGKEKSALLGAAEIALGLMGDGGVVIMEGRLAHVERLGVTQENLDRPLSAEETAGHAWGDPFMEHGLVAAGKKLCGMCSFRNRAVAGITWRYNKGLPCPWPEPEHPCVQYYRPPGDSKPPNPKKGLPVPEGVKFLYYGRPDPRPWKHQKGSRSHQGVVTVAWIEPSPGILRMAFSFCSPKDPWCKAAGRDMTITRLYEHPLVIPFLYSPKRTVHEVARAVLTHDFGRLAALTPGATMWGRVPSWTRGLAKRLKPRVLVVGPAPTFDEWKIMDRNLRRRFLGGAPSIDFSLGILTRMMADIAKLGND